MGADQPDRLVQAREADLARAARSLTGGAEGRGVVLVTGPAGVGKSWFARRLLGTLPDDVVAVAAAPPGDGDCPPLWPFRRAARALFRLRPAGPLAARLTAADAGHAPAPRDPADVEHLTEAFVDEYRNAPFVLVLEDVHRFDGLSLAALDALAQPLTATPVPLLVCGTTDPEVDGPGLRLLRALARRPGTEAVALAPLPPDAVAALVARHAPAGAPPALRDLAAQVSAGNPRAAIELAEVLPPGGDPLPDRALQGLRDALRDRLPAVDGHHGVLEALALVGRAATTSLLASAAETPILVARQVVDRAARAGLVEVSGSVGVVDFTHPVVRDAVASGVGADRARRLHYRLATLVAPGEVEGPAAVVRARHLLAAGDRSASAAQACLDASLHLERHGPPADAEGFARAGLEVPAAAPSTRVALLRTRARLLGRTGAWEQAREAAQQAVTLAGPLPERAALVHAVADLATADPQVVHVDPARRRLIEEALAEPACTGAVRAVLLARLSDTQLLADPDGARRTAEDALAVAEGAGDETATDAATAAWLTTHLTLDTVDEAEALTRRLVAAGLRPSPLTTLGPALVRGDRGVAEVVVEQLDRDLARAPHVRGRALADVARLGLAVCDGDAAAVERHAAALAAAPTAELQSLAVPMLAIWTALGGRPVAVPPSFGVHAPATSDLGRLVILTIAAAAAHDDRSAGTEHVAALLEPRSALVERRHDALGDMATALAALAGSATGDHELCTVAVERFTGHEDRFALLGVTCIAAPVGLLAAWAHHALGDLPAALRANERATAACRRARFDAWTAQCLLQRAELLVTHDPAAAVEAARDALSLALEHGLDRVAERSRVLAERRPRPASPLSPTQEQVLALVAAGCTNDQIARRLGCAVSTVEKHLTQVYRRLGVPNRAASARWFTTHRRS